MMAGHRQIKDLSDIKQNDIWVDEKRGHTEIVIKITPGKNKQDTLAITIRHDSSKQKNSG
jgi:hypothetical protein